MKKQILLTIALLTATKICTPESNKTAADNEGHISSLKSDENSGGFLISRPDTGGIPLTCVITGSSSICLGTSGILTSVASGGTPPFFFLWSNGQTTQSIFVSPAITTTFTVTVTDAIAAQSNCSKSVTVNPNPTVTVTGNTTICKGSSTVLTATGGTSYSWSPGTGLSNPASSNPNASPSATTTYTVTATNGSGCSATGSKKVIVNSLPVASITAAGPTTFCDGLNVTLNTLVAANRTYQWKNGGINIAGATSSSFIASVGGTYKVTVTNTVTGCTKVTGTGIPVSINPLPVAVISPSGTISFCAGQSALLTAATSFGNTYKWKRNNVLIVDSVSNTLTVTQAGKYNVVVTNAFSCLKASLKDTVIVPCREDMVEEGAFDLTIYPNPATDYLEFRLSTGARYNMLEIFIQLGQQVLNNAIDNDNNENYSKSLDIRSLPTGMYLLRVMGESGYQMKRFVKK